MATARKPRMKVAEPEATDDAPSVLSLKSTEGREVEWQDVFEIDGTMYQIRTWVPLNVSMQYTHLYRTQGVLLANSYMLEALLSPTAYRALMAFDGLESSDLSQVLTIAVSIMLGRVESPN